MYSQFMMHGQKTSSYCWCV